MRPCRALAAALAVAALPAQEPAEPPADLHAVRAKLASDDLASIAWGGWLVADGRLGDAEAEVRAALLRVRERAVDLPRRLTIGALLDALVRIDARVPARELVPLRREAPVQTLVLLAACADENEGLLLHEFAETGRDVGGAAWHACGNLLAALRTDGFAALALGEFETELSVFVVDDASRSGGWSTSGSTIGCGGIAAPDGFPPLAIYDLVRGGGTVFAPGPRPVGYSRAVRTAKRFGVGSHEDTVDPDELRRGWLAALLGVGIRELPLEVRAERSLVWSDEDALRADVLGIARSLDDGFADVRDALVDAGLLSTADAARLRLAVRLRLFDHRDGEPEPLSPLDAAVRDR